jgi:apolipoprotein N-acyltransferase
MIWLHKLMAVPERLAQLSPWRRIALLFGVGALAALAMPPFFLWPVLAVSLPFFFFAAVQPVSWRQAFWSGWWWALGYFVAGLYWIAHALLTDLEKFGWLIPFAVLGLPSVFAIYYGFAAIITWWCRRLPGALPVLACVVAITVCEWLRGWVLTGFPWNVPGYALNVRAETLQLAAWAGLWGATAVVVLFALSPAMAIRLRHWGPLLCMILLPAILYGAGQVRLQKHPTRYVEGVTLRLVQANVAQRYKWEKEARVQALYGHVAASNSTPLDQISAVIWSETAVPFFLDEKFQYVSLLSQAIPPNGSLLTGAMRAGVPPSEDAIPDFYNSLFALMPDGQVVSYDKRHLVPFGEFVPLREYVPLASIVYGGHDFSRGEGDATMKLANVPPFRPLICYEAIFPDEVKSSVGEAEWLLNITNDAWFGVSPGPYQHFEAARMRAVELGLPLVRVANTGVSGVVDAYGRIVHQTTLGEAAILDVRLPQAHMR